MQSQQGISLVLFTILIVPLLMMIALEVDGSRWITSKKQTEANAEVAAIAALEEFVVAGSATDKDKRVQQSINRAENSTALNLYLNRQPQLSASSSAKPPSGSTVKYQIGNGKDGTIQFGHYDFLLNTCTSMNTYLTTDPIRQAQVLSDPNGINFVKVTMNSPASASNTALFAGVFGPWARKIVHKGIQACAVYDNGREIKFMQPYRVIPCGGITCT